MYITDEKSAEKVVDLLVSAKHHNTNAKEAEAIAVAVDLIDELLVEGRWS